MLTFWTFAVVCWAAGGASPLVGYSLTLKEAQGMTICSYKYDLDVRNDRVPKAIEMVRCLSCGKECTPYGKTTSSCMQIMATHFVTYPSTGVVRNETYPVACVCVQRHPNRGFFEKVNVVE